MSNYIDGAHDLRDLLEIHGAKKIFAGKQNYLFPKHKWIKTSITISSGYQEWKLPNGYTLKYSDYPPEFNGFHVDGIVYGKLGTYPFCGGIITPKNLVELIKSFPTVKFEYFELSDGNGDEYVKNQERLYGMKIETIEKCVDTNVCPICGNFMPHPEEGMYDSSGGFCYWTNTYKCSSCDFIHTFIGEESGLN